MTHGPDVSVLLACHDRPVLVTVALACFARQQDVDAELVVVDDSRRPVPVVDDPRVCRLRLPHGTPLGTKLNAAAEVARGRVLVKWDDDDYYGPRFLASVTAPLTGPEATARVAFAQPFLLHDLVTGRLCRSDDDRCSGATLAITRSTWETVPFPDVRVAVDADFLRAVVDRFGVDACTGVWLDREFVQLRHDRHLWNHLPDGRPVDRYLLDCIEWPDAIEDLVPGDVLRAWRRHRSREMGLRT